MTKQIPRTDSIEVTPDEAVEHVVTHLRLAAMFFTNTPEDQGKAVEDEIERLAARETIGASMPPWYEAAISFNRSLAARFEQMKEDD